MNTCSQQSPRRARRLAGPAAVALAAMLAASPALAQPAQTQTQTQTACPAKLPAQTRCFRAAMPEGGFYWMAVPVDWSGVLVVHAHGGPELGPPRAERSAEDLQRWAVMVEAGHAWVGPTYRRGGFGVRSAAADLASARTLALAQLPAAPRRVLLHGQSWGAMVAAKTAELTPALWDGVLLSNGVLGGASAYDFRLDLRVVYQAICNNHPRPDEPAYPLWQGLPADSALSRAELARRVDECTGLRQPAAQRSVEQQQRLTDLLRVSGLEERALQGHLNWATWLFQDLVQQRLGGGNPFDNSTVRYQGSRDDAALNARVARYRADPQARQRLADDADPAGSSRLPTLSVHAVHDPVAFVELDAHYRAVRERGGSAAWLVQTFTDEAEHSLLSPVQYPALVDALLAWVEQGAKPTPAAVAQRCAALQPRFGGAACRFLPDYSPAPLSSRLAPR